MSKHARNPVVVDLLARHVLLAFLEAHGAVLQPPLVEVLVALLARPYVHREPSLLRAGK